MKDVNINKFGIVIIESLNKEDRKTGKHLHELINKIDGIKNIPFISKYYDINSKVELIKVFDSTIDDFYNSIYLPILHFETHGYISGLKLNSGELIDWEELFELTRKYNILLKNNLLLQLGMCFGLSLLSKLNPFDRAPFNIAIGVIKKIPELVLQKAFSEFYSYYFSHLILINLLKKQIVQF